MTVQSIYFSAFLFKKTLKIFIFISKNAAIKQGQFILKNAKNCQLHNKFKRSVGGGDNLCLKKYLQHLEIQ